MVTRAKKAERESQVQKRARARSMRHDSKYCERLLWAELRDRKLDGFKFRRQHMIGNYTVDYLCIERNLVVELDGGIHRLKAAEDSVRDAVLAVRSYRVLRLKNEDIVRDMPAALKLIRSALEK